MLTQALDNLLATSGFTAMTWPNMIMITVSLVLIYLAVVKKFEPLLLLPIAFGMLLANLPLTGLMGHPTDSEPGGLLYYLYQGVKLGIYPSLIFLGIGAMTDFGPLDREPEQPLPGRRRTVRHRGGVHHRQRARLYPAGSGLHRHHRRRGRPRPPSTSPRVSRRICSRQSPSRHIPIWR